MTEKINIICPYYKEEMEIYKITLETRCLKCDKIFKVNSSNVNYGRRATP